MKLLNKTYVAAMLAINAVPTIVGNQLLEMKIDFYSKKNPTDPGFDPNAIKYAIWILKKEQEDNTTESLTLVYCYYIAMNEKGRWCIRECNYTDFTELNFYSCPLHFLNKINIEKYDLLWVKAVRDYHSKKLQSFR